MKSKKLTSENLSYQCPLRLEDLSKEEGGYYCAKCDKEIMDLTECTIEDAIRIQRKRGQICGIVCAASAAAVLGVTSCSTVPDEDSKHRHKTGGIGNKEITSITLGYICPPEQLERSEDENAKGKDG